jgi:hypothetical protein
MDDLHAATFWTSLITNRVLTLQISVSLSKTA